MVRDIKDTQTVLHMMENGKTIMHKDKERSHTQTVVSMKDRLKIEKHTETEFCSMRLGDFKSGPSLMII